MTVDIYAPTMSDGLSPEERALYDLIMDYRGELGLPSIPLSASLTTVAGRHALDSRFNIWGEDLQLPDGANLHSWSDAPYFPDHRSPEVIWEAPQRLGTAYPGNGYEISAAGYRTNEQALEGWKNSPGHNNVIANIGPWANIEWNAIGVGVFQPESYDFDLRYGGFIYHVWFGAETDPAGAPASEGQGAPDIAVQSETLSVASVEAGGTLDAQWNVANVGSAGTNAGGRTLLMLSTDRTADASDTVLHDGSYRALAPGETDRKAQAGLSIAADVAAGDYFLLFTADPASGDTNTGNNTRAVPITVTTAAPAKETRSDFDNNGHDDILWRNGTDGTVGTWAVQGDGSHVWSRFGTARSEWEIEGVGDFDNNGHDDILWRNGTDGTVGTWAVQGDGSHVWSRFGTARSEWEIEGVGDFDNNGHDDILWRNGTDGTVGTWAVQGDGSHVWSRFGTARSEWEIEGVGDFDNNGHDDILWRNGTDGTVGTWAVQGDGSHVWSRFGTARSEWEIEGVGDFDNNGHDDILWRNGTDGTVGTWAVQGDGSHVWSRFGTARSEWEIEGVGDFDNNGHDDILWRNGTDGTVGTWAVQGDGSHAWSRFGSAGSQWDIEMALPQDEMVF